MAQPPPHHQAPHHEVRFVEEIKWMNKECFMAWMTVRMVTTEEASTFWATALKKCQRRNDPNDKFGVEVKVKVSSRYELTTEVTETVIE